MALRNGSPVLTCVMQAVLAATAALGATSAGGQPAGLQVLSGGATLARDGARLTITTTNNAAGYSSLQWQSFSVPGGTTTRIEQPSAASLSINRVVGDSPSAILGTLSSNGRVALVNPAGIAVGPNAVVDTAGFTASTLRMTDAEILAGSLRPADATRGGDLDIQGQVIARHGDVFLFGGTVRHSGVVQATSARLDGGRVVLFAQGDARVSGTVLARRTDAARGGEVGGAIDVLGDRVALDAGARLDASGAFGGGQVRVGGDFQGANPEVPNARFAWVDGQARIEADATVRGDGGRVIVWSDDTTGSRGAISARGGPQGGDGGFVEVSGKRQLDFASVVDTRAPAGRTGTLLLDPDDIVVATPDAGYAAVTDLADLGQTGTMQVSPGVLQAQTSDIVLKANNSIVFGEALTLTGAGGTAASLTAEAGGEVRVQAPLQAAGSITLTGMQGVTVDPGVAVSAGTSMTLSASSGTVRVGLGSTLDAGSDLALVGNPNWQLVSGVVLDRPARLRAGTVVGTGNLDIQGFTGDNFQSGVVIDATGGMVLTAGSGGQVRIVGAGANQGIGLNVTGGTITGTGGLILSGWLQDTLDGGPSAGNPVGVRIADTVIGDPAVTRMITVEATRHAVQLVNVSLYSGGFPIQINASTSDSTNPLLDGLRMSDVTLDATATSGFSSSSTVNITAVTRQVAEGSEKRAVSLEGTLALRSGFGVFINASSTAVPAPTDRAPVALSVGASGPTTVEISGGGVLMGTAQGGGTGIALGDAVLNAAAGSSLTLQGVTTSAQGHGIDFSRGTAVQLNVPGGSLLIDGRNTGASGGLPADGSGLRLGAVSVDATFASLTGRATPGVTAVSGAPGHLLQGLGPISLRALGGDLGTATDPVAVDIGGELTVSTGAGIINVHLVSQGNTLTVGNLAVSGDAQLQGAGAAPAPTLLSLRNVQVDGTLTVQDFAETELGTATGGLVSATAMDVSGHATLRGTLYPGGRRTGTAVFHDGLTVAAGATLEFDIDGTGASPVYDQVRVTGALEFPDPVDPAQRPTVALTAMSSTPDWTLPEGRYTLMTGTTDPSGATPLPHLSLRTPTSLQRLTLGYGSLVAVVPPLVVVTPPPPPPSSTPDPVASLPPDPAQEEPEALSWWSDPQYPDGEKTAFGTKNVVFSSLSCRRS